MIILKDRYINYENALEKLNLENLNERRQMLALRFANKCTQNDDFKDLFPMRDKIVDLRKSEKYLVKQASTQKLYKSSIPAMQRLLNKENRFPLPNTEVNISRPRTNCQVVQTVNSEFLDTLSSNCLYIVFLFHIFIMNNFQQILIN